MIIQASTVSIFLLLLITVVPASNSIIVKRGPTSNPACDSFAPYRYLGCWEDDSNQPGVTHGTLVYRANDLPSKGMTVEICTAYCKGNDYQYAGLEYYGQCWCGAGLSFQQVDMSNCNLPCDGNHAQVCGGQGANYGPNFMSIYQDPTYTVQDNTTIADYQALGCYTDNPRGTLPWQQTITESTVTVDSCLFLCKNGGYPYAGVEYAHECFCGVDIQPPGAPTSSGCTFACAGNSSQICGGSSVINIYFASDLLSNQPCVRAGPSTSAFTMFPSPTYATSPATISPIPSVVYTSYGSLGPTTCTC